jgi:class 3 adenylate cyclase
MRAVVVTRSVDLVAPPERVWPLITDTDRWNRINGSAGVNFTPIEADSKDGARFVAQTRAGGLSLTYEEFPFEWTHLKTFGVHRRMRGGLIESYTWRVTLEPTGGGRGAAMLEGGTRATVRFEIVPRSIALWPVAWANARSFAAKFVELGKHVDAHVLDGAASPYQEPVSPTDPALIEAAASRLRSDDVPAPLVETLRKLVEKGPDADVVRMRPFELADTWGQDRRAVLRAFLRAVPAGLVELRWGIVCPSCVTSSQQVRALDEVSLQGHCQLCDISFDLDLDRAVEATFLPHPSVRKVPEAVFCIGGPARTPHVLVQAIVPPRGDKILEVPAEVGRFRLFARGGAAATLEVDDHGATQAEATLAGGKLEPAHLHVAPGASLRFRSTLDEALHVKIERLAFASAAATAHAVSTMPEFRTLFSGDLLKRGTPLKVARAAMLFSDLTGSTALYTDVGDAAAFRLVDDHFDVLRAVVAEHGGAVVKTMGDAVMAAFTDTGSCARAAVEALARFEAFRKARPHGEKVGLKVGLFAGPCYVVTANGVLDYFGQTVNVASRVQHLAGSGELVLPGDALDALEPSVRERVVERERFEARVKGVENALALVRVTLAP